MQPFISELNIYISQVSVLIFVICLHRSSKLTMLLRESLAHANCHIAVVAQVADSLAHLQETFSTIQLASRIRRTQKRTKVLFLKAQLQERAS